MLHQFQKVVSSPLFNFLFFGGHLCVRGCGFCASPPIVFWKVGGVNKLICNFFCWGLKVPNKLPPYPKSKRKRTWTHPPTLLKKNHVLVNTPQTPPKNKQKKGFIPTSNLPRTKVKGLYFSNNFYWNFKVP